MGLYAHQLGMDSARRHLLSPVRTVAVEWVGCPVSVLSAGRAQRVGAFGGNAARAGELPEQAAGEQAAGDQPTSERSRSFRSLPGPSRHAEPGERAGSRW